MKNKTRNTIKKTVLAAMFVAIGIVLPFFTGQIQQIGNLLLPMHLPVFLCGMICGWQYGTLVGFMLPLMRSLLFSMPKLYPTAMSMAIELAVYGLISGLIYSLLNRKSILTIYISLISAMLCGRLFWGLTQLVLLGIEGNGFTWQMFISGAFLQAIPGIALQLILIPAIMSALNFTDKLKYENGDAKCRIK